MSRKGVYRKEVITIILVFYLDVLFPFEIIIHHFKTTVLEGLCELWIREILPDEFRGG